MILQALYEYYERLSEIPRFRYRASGVWTAEHLLRTRHDRDGMLVKVEDIRDTSGKKPRPIALMVPEAVIKTSRVASNFLWENSGYVLGAGRKG